MKPDTKQIYTYEHFREYFDRYDAFQIGSATCPHLLPSLHEFKKIIKNSRKKIVSLLLPPLTENFINLLAGYLNIVENEKLTGLAVTFNDWGAYHFLKDKPCKPVVGGWLLAQKKDPILGLAKNLDKTANLANYNNRVFLELLKKLKLDTLAIENPMQGISFENLENFNINIYTPYVIYSYTRQCPLANFQHGQNKRIITLDCRKSCLAEKPLIYNKNYFSYYSGNFQSYQNKILPNRRFNQIIDNSIIVNL